MPNQDIYSLLGSRDGGLYIGTGGGLARLDSSGLYQYPEHLFNIRPLVEDQQGTIWMGQRSDETGNHVLCKVGHLHIECLGTKDGFKLLAAYSIFPDHRGSLWVGNNEGIDHWQQGSPPTHYPAFDSGKNRSANDYVTSFARDQANGLWAGVVSSGAGHGLLKFQNGKWATYITPQIDGSKLAVRHLFATESGALWIGTTGNGIYRLNDGRLDHFSASDGLSGDGVNGFFEDREGNLWALTDDGLDMFRDLSILSFSTREGLSDDSVQALAATADNDVWIGTRTALNVLHGREITRLSMGHGLPTDSVLTLYRDSQDRIWMADQAGRFFKYQRGVFTPISGKVGVDNYFVFDFMEDEAHRIWASGFEAKQLRRVALLRLEGSKVVGTSLSPDPKGQGLFLARHAQSGLWAGGNRRGLYRFHDNVFTPISSPVARDGFRFLNGDEDGGVWSVTAKHEIYFYRDGHTQRLTTQNGLPCDLGSQIIADHRGSHWLFLACGIARIPDQEILKWSHDSHYRLHADVVGIQDGFRPGYAKAILAPDGRLWMTNGRIAQVIDPAHLVRNTFVPPVQIERLVVDGVEQPPTNAVRMRTTPRQIEIDYAGLSYTVPEQVKFRYILEGYETAWNEVGGRRQAFYSKLKPGHYRFRVLASNNDGLWNTTGATLNFTVPPAWYQTWWFRIPSVALLAALLYLIYLLRLRQYSAVMKIAFRERLEERGRIARELHDTLIQSVDGLMLYLQSAIDEDDRDRSRQMLIGALDRAGEVISEGRERVHTLRTEAMPGNELSQALVDYGKEHVRNRQVEFLTTTTGGPKGLELALRDEAFCIGREALANAFQHSGASKIELHIHYERNSLRLIVRDNGIGIEPSILEEGKQGHWGLSGMRERAKQVSGQLTIRSQSNVGTEITITIPTRTAFLRWLNRATLDGR